MHLHFETTYATSDHLLTLFSKDASWIGFLTAVNSDNSDLDKIMFSNMNIN